MKFLIILHKNFLISLFFPGPKLVLLLENRTLLARHIRSLSQEMSKQNDITNHTIFQAKSFKLTNGSNSMYAFLMQIEIVQFHNFS